MLNASHNKSILRHNVIFLQRNWCQTVKHHQVDSHWITSCRWDVKILCSFSRMLQIFRKLYRNYCDGMRHAMLRLFSWNPTNVLSKWTWRCLFVSAKENKMRCEKWTKELSACRVMMFRAHHHVDVIDEKWRRVTDWNCLKWRDAAIVGDICVYALRLRTSVCLTVVRGRHKEWSKSLFDMPSLMIILFSNSSSFLSLHHSPLTLTLRTYAMRSKYKPQTQHTKMSYVPKNRWKKKKKWRVNKVNWKWKTRE